MIKIRCDRCVIILALVKFACLMETFPITLRPFRELAHGLRSGPIQLIDFKTIFVQDLHYDGRGPDAYFWIGNGERPSTNGTRVPYGGNDTLPAFNGQNVTIQLPVNVSVNDIDYVGIWCVQYQQNFGHVLMNETLRDWRLEKADNFLQPFRLMEYFLQSGPIQIVNNTVFLVTNFYYDGSAPDAHFWIGRDAPSSRGTLVPDENNSTASLSAYNGKNLTLHLPGNFTVNDIDYLAVWNSKNGLNLGHVFTDEVLGYEDNPYYDVMNSDIAGIQLEEFERLKHGLRSGPILLIDERTFYIPNLHYDGKGPDAHFWVGTGTEPSASGIKIPGENFVYAKTLPKYDGKSIYIKLPDSITVRDIEYLGVWCIQYKQNFGHISIPKNLKIPAARRYPSITEDGRKIIRVPKCCNPGMIVETSGCRHDTEPFNISISIHMSNATHLNDEPLARNRIVYVPYVQNVQCQKYPLEPDKDNYSLLTSGSLLYISEKRKLPLDEYCIDTVDLDGKYITTPFVCAILDDAPNIYILYAVGIFISCVFLAITSGLYAAIKKIRDVHGVCVIGYTASMAVSFFCLGLTQVAGAERTCHVLGFIFQFTIVSSFTWFTAMCFESWFKTKYFKHDSYILGTRRKRIYVYTATAFFCPLVFFLASVIYDVVPLMPTNYLESTCRFTSDVHKKLFLFIPVVSSIVINIVMLTWTGFIIRENDRSNNEAWNWGYDNDIKWKFRGCIFLVILMVLCWLAEVVTYLFDKPVMFLDVIHSLQGVMVLLILLLTEHPRREIVKFFRYNFKTLSRGNETNGRMPNGGNAGNETEMVPLNDDRK